ncbi:serine palmitoyltransferase small subunit B isoform 1-T1 [Thomomys bottae]
MRLPDSVLRGPERGARLGAPAPPAPRPPRSFAQFALQPPPGPTRPWPDRSLSNSAEGGARTPNSGSAAGGARRAQQLAAAERPAQQAERTDPRPVSPGPHGSGERRFLFSASEALTMDFKRVKEYFAWLYFQYQIISCCSVMEPWEKSMFNTILFSIVAMVVYTAYVFIPIHIRLAWEFFSRISGYHDAVPS